MEKDKIVVQVAEKKRIAEGIISLTLKPVSTQLAEWSSGAHVDIFLPNDKARQYSIINSYGLGNQLTVVIFVDKNGRGGSLWIDENTKLGSELTIGKPRNHFEYRGESDKPKTFIAGGIGITPLLPMIEQAEADNSSWELHYIGRSLASMAFVEELKRHNDKVHFYPRDTTDRPDFTQIIDGNNALDVYCCGPEKLMDSLEELGSKFKNVTVFTESFSPKTQDEDGGFDEFEVEFNYSGITSKVNSEQSILEVAEAAGIYVSNSCTNGICGSCETPIISGEVVHLDSVLSEIERTASKAMMICVSRAKCSRLVLDL